MCTIEVEDGVSNMCHSNHLLWRGIDADSPSRAARKNHPSLGQDHEVVKYTCTACDKHLPNNFIFAGDGDAPLSQHKL